MFESEIDDYYYIQIPWTFKDYKIIEEIGKGVFSSVVKVIKQSTNQIYAAKIMAKESTEYFDEIEIHCSLNHPNIVKLEEVIEITNEYCVDYVILIQEYCSHGDLLTNLLEDQIKTTKEKKQIAKGIIEAVTYLHEHNIAHCDIKLDNILLDENNVPKICDFTFSIDTTINVDTFKGFSLLYSPPELREKDHSNIDFLKADIWSLGMALFAIFEERIPYPKDGDDDYDMSNLVIDTRNKKLESLILKCLCIDAKERVDAKLLIKDPYLNYIVEEEEEEEEDIISNDIIE